jgi:DUF971 family protein
VQLAATVDALVITWSDGVDHCVPWQLLRDRCPCATCQTARRQPPPAPLGLLPVLSTAEAQPLKPTKVTPSGNYGYAIHFNDGHNTGIYGLDLLRQLGEEAAA